MTLTELQNEVIALTKRPDLSTMINTAVKAATLKLHQMEFFSKDLVETTIDMGTAAYTQSYSYITAYPQWRAISYIRKIDLTTNLPYDPPLEILTPTAILDAYSATKVDIVYEAGRVLQFTFKEPVQKIQVGYYANPVVTDAGYSSWIAISYPYAIVFDAAATIFKSIGFGDMEASMRLLTGEQKQLLLQNNIQIEGY